jgi:hypothetical protein
MGLVAAAGDYDVLSTSRGGNLPAQVRSLFKSDLLLHSKHRRPLLAATQRNPSSTSVDYRMTLHKG